MNPLFCLLICLFVVLLLLLFSLSHFLLPRFPSSLLRRPHYVCMEAPFSLAPPFVIDTMETCAFVLPLKRSDRIRQLIVILISHNAQTVKTKPEIIGVRHGESIPADDVQMAK